VHVSARVWQVARRGSAIWRAPGLQYRMKVVRRDTWTRWAEPFPAEDEAPPIYTCPDKLKLIGGLDPYETDKKEWKDDVDLCPCITHVRIS